MQNAPTEGDGFLLAPFTKADLEWAMKRPTVAQAGEEPVLGFFNKILLLHGRNIGSPVLYVKKILATKVGGDASVVGNEICLLRIES